MIDKFIEKTIVVFKWITILYLFVATFYFMGLPRGRGDESLFLSDLQLIKNIGWYESIVKNVSILYMLLAYPLSFIMEDFMALRMINIVLLILLFLYFFYVGKVKAKTIYYYLFFFISTVGYFYFGTNDCLFFVSLIIVFNEVNNAVNDKGKNFNLALSALIIAFFTRELFLVYLPILFLGIYILYKSGFRFTKKKFYSTGDIYLVYNFEFTIY